MDMTIFMTVVITVTAGLSLLFLFLSGHRKRDLLSGGLRKLEEPTPGLETDQQMSAPRATLGGLMKAVGRISGRLLPGRLIKWCEAHFPLGQPPWGLNGQEAAGTRVFLAVLSAAVAIIIFKLDPLGLVTAAALGAFAFFLPSLAEKWERKAFMQEVERGLPQIADLMYASLLGGKSVMGALEVAAMEGRGAAVELFRQACKELSMGTPKKQAFSQMLEVCPSRDLSLLLHSMLRSERHGYSLTETLKAQADHLRFKNRAYRKSQAYKMPLKMLVPLVFLILPASILLILGPVILSALSRLS